MRRAVPLARIWVLSLGAAASLLFAAAWFVDRDPGVVAEAQALADANALVPQLEAAAESLHGELARGGAEVAALSTLVFDVGGRLVKPAPLPAAEELADTPGGGEAALPTPAASWLTEAVRFQRQQDWESTLEATRQGLATVRPNQEAATWAGLMLAQAQAEAASGDPEMAVETLVKLERATQPGVSLNGRPLRLLTRFRMAEAWEAAGQDARAKEVRGALLGLLLDGKIPMAPSRLRFYVESLREQVQPDLAPEDHEPVLQSFELAAEIQRQIERNPNQDSVLIGTRAAFLDRQGGRGQLYDLQAVNALVAERLQSMLPASGAFQLASGSSPAEGAVKSVLRLAPIFGLRRLVLVQPGVYQRPAVRRRQYLFIGASLVIAALALVGVWGARALRRRAELERLRSDFVAGISHELRTPAASIALLATNLAEGRILAEERRQQYYDALRRDAQRLQRLVADVLDVSRLERGSFKIDPHPQDAGPLITSVAEDLRPRLADAGLELQLSVDEDMPECTLDAEALERTLSNLLENARKYAAEGGVVMVRASSNEQHLVVEVEDRGPGIPSHLHERVFQVFERGEAESGLAGGAGLGLALVRESLEAHGGTVELSSGGGHDSLTRGALFRLSFPLSSE